MVVFVFQFVDVVGYVVDVLWVLFLGGVEVDVVFWCVDVVGYVVVVVGVYIVDGGIIFGVFEFEYMVLLQVYFQLVWVDVEGLVDVGVDVVDV